MAVRLHTVGLVVQNMARSLAFYRTLGLDIPADEDHAPHVEFAGANGLVMGFDTEEAVLSLPPLKSTRTTSRRLLPVPPAKEAL